MNASTDPGDSLAASLGRSGRGKLIGLAAIVAVAGGAGLYLTFGSSGSRGETDRPDAVLVVGPESFDLAPWLNGRGFRASQMSYAAAVAAGQGLDPSSEGLAAAAVYADQHGYGYLAVHPPDIHTYEGWATPAMPEAATMAVLSIGDLAKPATVTFGAPASTVEHEPPLAQQVGLFLALFEQPALAQILAEEVGAADMDAYNALGEKDALNRYKRLQESQRKFETIDSAWEEAASIVDPPMPTAAIGRPFEQIDAYPLADGGIVSLASIARWQTKDGNIATLVEDAERVVRHVSAADVRSAKGEAKLTGGEPCGPLDTTGVDAIRVNEVGDAMALRRHIADGTTSSGAQAGHWAVQFSAYGPGQRGCPFALVGHPLQSRQRHELGPPHPSGAMLMVSERVRFGFNGRERSWNYPMLGPDGGAAAWIDGTLVAYAGSSKYQEADNHGLAFMTTLTENRLEAFVPMQTLLPNQDVEPLEIEHIDARSADRFLLVVANRRDLSRFLLEVAFTRPVRSLLIPIDHNGDLPRQLDRATIRARTGIDTRVVINTLPDFDDGTLDASGRKLAYAHEGRALLLDLDTPGVPRPLTPANHEVSQVRIAPSGEFAIVHRTLEVSATEIRTAYLVWLD
jgi:hypothetical protein